MSALIPFFILIMLIHAGVFVTSDSSSRFLKLYMALGISSLAIPLFLFSFTLPQGSLLFLSMSGALLYLPALSLFVYLPSWWKK